MSPLRWIGLWTPVLAYMAAVLLLPGPGVVPVLESVWDKALHTVAYGAFAVLCLRATHRGFGPLRERPALAGVLLAAVFGGLDEWNQTRLPGRHPSALDWCADLVGIAAAVGAYALVCGRDARRRHAG